jgi:hypothetical protein
VRFGIVGYRDFGDREPIVSHDLTYNHAEFCAFVK